MYFLHVIVARPVFNQSLIWEVNYCQIYLSIVVFSSVSGPD